MLEAEGISKTVGGIYENVDYAVVYCPQQLACDQKADREL